jgi:hypothetical protein
MKYTCTHCGKDAPQHNNYCSWECNVRQARALGGKIINPNIELPIACIRGDMLLEHEHADHPDYKFPVNVDYIGKIVTEDITEHEECFGNKADEARVREFRGETHALIYSDGYVAVTTYEHCYAMWHLRNGMLAGGSLWKMGEWKLSKESSEKIRALHDDK